MGAYRRLILAISVLVLVASACSDSDSTNDEAGGDTTTSSETTDTTTARAPGPVADLSEELAGGNGVFIGSPDAARDDGGYLVELDAPGYVQEEFVASGTAGAYVLEGEMSPDGEWTLGEGETADYRSRVLVRRPA
jgi:hypothetical protein